MQNHGEISSPSHALTALKWTKHKINEKCEGMQFQTNDFGSCLCFYNGANETKG